LIHGEEKERATPVFPTPWIGGLGRGAGASEVEREPEAGNRHRNESVDGISGGVPSLYVLTWLHDGSRHEAVNSMSIKKYQILGKVRAKSNESA